MRLALNPSFIRHHYTFLHFASRLPSFLKDLSVITDALWGAPSLNPFSVLKSLFAFNSCMASKWRIDQRGYCVRATLINSVGLALLRPLQSPLPPPTFSSRKQTT